LPEGRIWRLEAATTGQSRPAGSGQSTKVTAGCPSRAIVWWRATTGSLRKKSMSDSLQRGSSMPTHDSAEGTRLFAQAIYEIRLLLGSHLGSSSDCSPEVRMAAHLAYALHNQALQSLAGQSVDVAQAKMSIAAVDRMLNSNFSPTFDNVL
jgi:hypothetical protein